MEYAIEAIKVRASAAVGCAACDHRSPPPLASAACPTHCRCPTSACLQLGSTAIAVRTDEGVVMAVEKRVTSPLLVRGCAC